jgi:hypothetical protein
VLLPLGGGVPDLLLVPVLVLLGAAVSLRLCGGVPDRVGVELWLANGVSEGVDDCAARRDGVAEAANGGPPGPGPPCPPGPGPPCPSATCSSTVTAIRRRPMPAPGRSLLSAEWRRGGGTNDTGYCGGDRDSCPQTKLRYGKSGTVRRRAPVPGLAGAFDATGFAENRSLTR